jgi:predicted nucleic acid-binding protein
METLMGTVRKAQKMVRDKMSQGIGRRRAWATSLVTLTKEELQALEEAQSELKRNEWEQKVVQGRVDRKMIYLATDACDFGKGGVEMKDGKKVENSVHSKKFELADVDLHISIKEWRILKEYVDERTASFKDPTLVIVCEDNSSVTSWIRRQFCPNEKECNSLREWLSSLEERAVQLELIQVPTDCQPADGPSRLEPWSEEDDERVKRAWEIIQTDKEIDRRSWSSKKRKRTQ